MLLRHWLSAFFSRRPSHSNPPTRRASSRAIISLSALEHLERRTLLAVTFNPGSSGSSLFAQVDQSWYNPIFGIGGKIPLDSKTSDYSQSPIEANWHGDQGVYFAQASGSSGLSGTTLTLDQKVRAEAAGTNAGPANYTYESLSSSDFQIVFDLSSPANLNVASSYLIVPSDGGGAGSLLTIAGPQGTKYFLSNGYDGTDQNEQAFLTPGYYVLRLRSDANAGIGLGQTASISVASVVHAVLSFESLKSTPSLSLSASTTTPERGDPVTFYATLQSSYLYGAAPTGNVSFYEGNTLLGTGTLDSSNTATFETSSLSAGPHVITAVYEGDDNYDSANSYQSVNVNVIAPRVVPITLKINPDNKAVDFLYEIRNTRLRSDTEIDLYFSASASAADIIGGPILVNSIPKDTPPGAITVLDFAVPPSTVPLSANFILLVADPNHVIQPAVNDDNVLSVAIQSPRQVINVLTHGWRSSGKDFEGKDGQPGFDDKMNSLPTSGSLLEGRIKTITPTWDSNTGFNEAFGFEALSDIGSTQTLSRLFSLNPLADIAGLIAQNLAVKAAVDIVKQLESGYLFADRGMSNAQQVVQLIGHSRGASVNALVSRLLANDGYSNVTDYIALDGFSTDWPVVGAVMGSIDIDANATAQRKLNYRVQQGLSATTGLNDIVLSIMGKPPNSTLSAPLFDNFLTNYLGDLRAPSRASAGFQDILAGDGGTTYTTHLNIVDEYFNPQNYNLDPAMYYLNNYEGRNRNAGLQGDLPTNSSLRAPDASILYPSLSADAENVPPTFGFIDPHFDLLGSSWSAAQSAPFTPTGDEVVDFFQNAVTDPAWLLSGLWTVTGNAKLALLQGNNVAELVNNQALASMSQTILLPPHASSASFDLGVKTAQAGDTLEVLYDGQLLKSIPLSASSSSTTLSIPLPANAPSTGAFQIRFSSTTGKTADVTLDNFAIQSTTNAPVIVPKTPLFPIISATDPLPQNQGISLQAWQSGITSVNPTDLLGIAITAADSTQGIVQFSTDSGTTWNDVGAVSNTHALALRLTANNRLRFVPNGYFAGALPNLLQFRAWDQTTSGYSTFSGDYVDTSLNGGSTPFSTATDTASIKVTGIALSSAAFALGQPTGSLVATLSSTSAIPGETFSYQFTSDGYQNDNSLFSIAGNAFKTISTLFSLGNTYRVVIHALGSQGTEFDRTFTITAVKPAPVLNPAGNPPLNPIVEDVTDLANTGTQVSQIITRMAPQGGISDVAGYPSGIAIIGADQSNGTWQFKTSAGWTNFGSTKINNALLLSPSSLIRFLPKPDYNGSAGITFIAWDQLTGTEGQFVSITASGGTTSFSSKTENAFITVTPVQDAPLLSTTGNPTLSPIAEDLNPANNTGTLVSQLIVNLTTSGGGIADPDTNPLKGIAVTSLDQTKGTWQFSLDNGSNWTPFGTTTASAARLLAANATTRIRFLPNLNYNGNATFIFVAWDQTTGTNGGTAVATSRGGTKAFSLTARTATLTVLAVNDPPVLNPNGDPILTPIAEDATTNAGTLVSTLIASMAPQGSITDPDTAAKQGIAVIGANQAAGKWQFTTDATTWKDFGTTSAANALLLASDAKTRIRFLPNLNYNGTVGITFIAWDQTSGSNGLFTPITTTGGISPFSTAKDNAFITVTPVNDAPVLNNAGNPTLISITKNVPLASNTGTLVSQIIASMAPQGGITDVDPNPQQGIAIIGANQLAGSWQYTTNGTTWTTFGTINITNSLLLAADAKTRIRFLPNPNTTGQSGISFVAWDQSTGTNGLKTPITATGGTTAFSTKSETALITITA